ncbi:BZ3501_MvSof-1269-A2-R1_Chr3-2g06294 [Microbotryum saponariae]|nr:BZ3501_MvSof-1269-A2-R1_Chr3-2g06294 [Microbotryum saponariae]
MASTRDIRVCLVGDEGVGKSTLISSLIKEHFVKLAPRTVLPEVTIPPSVTPGHQVTTIIIDTSHRAHLVNEIRKAHVVAIVYAIDNPTSFDRVPTYWLPTIRSLGVNVPVILIGNKIDLRSGQVTNEALEDECVPIMHEFKEVETVVECSAKLPLNVGECFYFAQNAVLHPTAPLYDTREHTLKPACVAALSRIFKLCDINKDGLLSDDELNDFQRVCFDAPLQARELAGIKEVVSRGTQDDHQPAIVDDALTEEGFLYLHTYFIQKGRLETTWKALRTFGYGEDLSLREDFLHPRFDIPADCTAELSPKGYQWFTDIFETFDKDRDGALAACELDDLFSTSPGNPWLANGFPGTTITNDGGNVTLQGWLAQWSMTTLLEPRVTLAYLAYLGYSHSGANGGSGIGPGLKSSDPTSALIITRPRKQDRKKGTVQRNVFLAYVLGAAGSGKTNLLRAFVGKGFRERHEPTMRNETVVGSVEWGGGEKYLVLQEFGSNYESEMLRMAKKLAMADALIFVYDSSDTNSFSYISNLRQQFKLDDHPSLFVATKSDLDLAQQRHEVQPDTYCRKLGLQVPVAVSVKQAQLADLFHTITSVATHPYVGLLQDQRGGVGGPRRLRFWTDDECRFLDLCFLTRLSSIPNSNRKNANSSRSLLGLGIPANAGFTTCLYATAGVVGLFAAGAMVWKSVVKGKAVGGVVVGGLGGTVGR